MNWFFSLYQAAINNSKTRWIIIIAIIIYFISPVDFLPEIILGPFGYIDDGVILSFLVNQLLILRKKNKEQKAQEIYIKR